MLVCSVCRDINPTVSQVHKVSFGAADKKVKAFDIHLTVITNLPVCNICLNSLLTMHLSPRGGMGRWLAVAQDGELTKEQLEQVKAKGKGTLIEVEDKGAKEKAGDPAADDGQGRSDVAGGGDGSASC